jgi:(1->4)-alpha-D-glucan 1-alpha-D-glucosylmutase
MPDQQLSEWVHSLLRQPARAPRSTYRLQMHAGFPLAEAESILTYLQQLGIGDCYLSPIFEARPGSMHGYDVTRHDRINPELGGDAAFERFAAAARAAGMGVLLDIVPNHMGVGNDAVWWQDVLENGHASEYATYFDIDWNPLTPQNKGKLLLPILGCQYGEELENKRIQVVVEDGLPGIRYFDHRMPIAPRTLPALFPEDKYEEWDVPQSFRDLLRELLHIPPHESEEANLIAQRREQLTELRPRLHAALRAPGMESVLSHALERINGREHDPRSFDPLHELLALQPYRLAYWRVSSEEINYRRFFDINDLVGLRMENPHVFAATHGLLRRLLAREQVTGLRIDHCDGLFGPQQYLIRLQMLFVASRGGGEAPRGPVAPNGIELDIRESFRGFDWSSIRGPLYVVVEKILEPGEALPREWAVQGTSGYDFVHFANQVFIDRRNAGKFTDFYQKFLTGGPDPDEIIYRSKLNVMLSSLSSEVFVLTNLLYRFALQDRRARDFTESLLETAIRETIACFPVYRTYIDDRGQYTELDRTFIRQAIARARRRNPDVDPSAFAFLAHKLLPAPALADGAIDKDELYFALKFQQLTGPVMAKGVEDTAFYIYTRFLSSNEVGSSMKSFGLSAEVFHEANRQRLANAPHAMLATSTHDTKRSEDVRNRLNVLSELPNQWAACVRRWTRSHARFKRTLDDGRLAPDPNEEYLLYQTLIGSWPLQASEEHRHRARILEYLPKALNEAKINSSWINPDQPYLDAVKGFAADILQPGPRGREGVFASSLHNLLPLVELFGAINSLAQVVLKIASPGVPDFYQGSELWDLSLVDPDNRRPVDYKLRSAALTALRQQCGQEGAAAVCQALLEYFHDGRIKLWTMHRALELRNQLAQVFAEGDYDALQSSGARAEHVLALARAKRVIAAVPLFACTLMKHKPALPLGPVWGGDVLQATDFAGAELENVFTGERLRVPGDGRLPLAEVFAQFPVALLVRRDGADITPAEALG